MANLCKRKGQKQFEIELRDATGQDRFEDEYGFADNPPIVLCAKNKKDVKKKLKLPSGVKIAKIEKV
jgi:hypothetical protein